MIGQTAETIDYRSFLIHADFYVCLSEIHLISHICSVAHLVDGKVTGHHQKHRLHYLAPKPAC